MTAWKRGDGREMGISCSAEEENREKITHRDGDSASKMAKYLSII